MISIDLKKLTPEHFKQAEAVPEGSCDYADPCIIGTLIPEDERNQFSGSIGRLITDDCISAPEDQFLDINRLQVAFDNRYNSPEAYQSAKELICQKYNI